MPLQSWMEKKLQENFTPEHLHIENESRFHSSMPGDETHFKVLCISEKFQGVNPVERHRQINALLKEAFEKGVHALSLKLYTPEEWKKTGKVIPSPGCAHED